MVNISFTMFCLHLKKLQHSIEINNIGLNSSVRFKFRKTLADQLKRIEATLEFWWNFGWKSTAASRRTSKERVGASEFLAAYDR